MEATGTTRQKSFLTPLIIGGILQALPVLFSGNTFFITVSSLCWPFCFLLASRRAETKRRFWLCMAVLAFTKFLRNMLLYGFSPLYMLGVFALSSFIALCESAAFGIDRIFTRGDKPLSSLVFPILFTASTCLIVMLNIGNLTDPGAAIAHIPVFAQNASLLLEHGLCFVLMWVSSMLAFACDGGQARRLVYISISILLTIVLSCFGLIRLAGKKEPDARIRVAFCTSFEEPFDSVASKRSEEEYYQLVDRQLGAAAKDGAQLAMLVEEHICLRAEDLFDWLDRFSGLVSRYGMPVLLPIEVVTAENEKNINEAILFDRSGKPVLTYVKNNLVPLLEDPNYEDGPESIGQAVIDIGGHDYKVAVVICFDCNDAAFIHKMDEDTDILLCPSWEWFSCNREQSRTAVLRAIENSVTLIKASQDGYHTVADPYGTIVFSECTEGNYEAVTVADVPVYTKAEGAAAMILPTLSATSASELSSAIMLLILFVAMCFQTKESDKKSRIYIVCLAMSILGLLFDAFSYIFDGSRWSNGLCFIVNLCSYIFVDIVMIAFALYFRALLSERRSTHVRAIYATMLIPFLDIIFLIYSAASGRLFTISNGTFVAGPWDTYSGFAPAASILSVLIIAVTNRKKLDVREYSAIILYMILPLGASLIVTFLGGIDSLSYVAVSLSMLILFVLIQSGTIEESRVREKVLSEVSLLDQLTALGNRRAYDKRLADNYEFAPFAAVFCDVNGLKETNDTYGHAAGDELLLRFTNLLRQHFDSDDIFRISGDEFVVLPSDPTPENLERIVARFKEDVTAHNTIAAVGWAFGAAAERIDIVKLAETRMYADKRRFHEQKGDADKMN